MTEPVSITLEFTPNPNTLKFVVNRSLLERGAANFLDASRAEKSPLALKLFAVSGVQAVMVGTSFVTITKTLDGSWDVLAEQVPLALETHLNSGEPTFTADFLAQMDAPRASSGTAGGNIEQRIRDVLDSEIRPAVAMDGGDITFDKFENGIVYLHLQGSCSSCPSATATLKMGVESRLKEAVPEVQEVVQVV